MKHCLNWTEFIELIRSRVVQRDNPTHKYVMKGKWLYDTRNWKRSW